MNLNKLHTIYFLGIGGIGMSALARYFNSMGKSVSGYDKTQTQLTEQLINEGISIHFKEDINAIPMQIDLVIYTPAIPVNHKELIYLKDTNQNIKKRSEVLGLITKEKFSIAVAGTHGKTTISSLITHILCYANKNITAFVGGITQNYNSNLILSKNTDTIVVEADEFDRSFLQLTPDIAVISSMDADHLDIYKNINFLHESFNLFAKQVKSNGKLIVRKGLPIIKNHLSYGFEIGADYAAVNIRQEHNCWKFDVVGKHEIKNITISSSAYYNIENSLAAIAVAIETGIDEEYIRGALLSYSGVKRRFEYIVNLPKIIYIDDYAHHPEELKASISSARKLFPNKKITGIFQPHLFTRTRDFADGFAESLEMLDEIILLEIYPAREEPIENISSQWLLNKIKNKNKFLYSKENLVTELQNKNLEVLMTLGAGDIDKMIVPIKKMLENKYEDK